MSATPAARTPLRVTVYGSCVARDSVALAGGGDQSTVTTYIARQSLLSAGSDASDRYPAGARTAHRFRRRMLRADFAGDLEAKLHEFHDVTDVLLWDLADERDGVLVFDDGKVVTRTFDLLSEPEVWEAAQNARHLDFGTDEHFEKWAEKARSFVENLKEMDLFDRTVVLRIPWAMVTNEGEAAPGSMGKLPIEANYLYERYYDHLVGLGVRTLEIDPELLIADPQHRWGLAPFHYTQDAYDAVMQQVFESAGRTLEKIPEPAAPVRVTIYGGPVARDAIDLAAGRGAKITDHVSRNSLLSFGTNGAAMFPQEVTGVTRSLLRALQTDFAGRMPSLIRAAAEKTDVLLWDLTDERDGVSELADGTILTRSVDGLEIPEVRSIHEGGAHIAFGTQEHYVAWKGQARRFQRVLQSAGVFDKTLVLDVPWARTTIDGEEITSSNGLSAEEANRHFRRYVHYLKALGFRIVSLTENEVHADPEHRWGPAPYHYTQDVYDLIVERAFEAVA
ncbi:DUF6270 domain-containing protein [Brachybacterium sp. AOP24-D1-21]|uniref:DUF6270 domain-containing protein n=1 Tax=Brachybacterium sp. AOP24-D1-21 TaxID=3457711 RepID=UPI0040332351